MRKYEDAMQVFNASELDMANTGPDNDPGVPLKAQGKKTLAVIRQALADATSLAATEAAKAGGDVTGAELQKLFDGERRVSGTLNLLTERGSTCRHLQIRAAGYRSGVRELIRVVRPLSGGGSASLHIKLFLQGSRRRQRNCGDVRAY